MRPVIPEGRKQGEFMSQTHWQLVESPLVRAAVDFGGAPVESSPQMLQQTLHAIRRHLGMEAAFISELHGGKRTFRYVDQDGDLPILHAGGSGDAEESYCKRVIDGRLPELITNAVDLPAACELLATFDLPIGAHMSVPIRFSDGRVFGTLCCFDRKADESLNERDLGLMRVLAEFVAAQLERQQQALDLHRERHERVRAVLDHKRFHMVLQPIVELAAERPAGYEALARFDAEPEQSPPQWISDAASVGLAVDLELALMGEALKVLEDLPVDIYLSLNVSPQVIRSGRLEALLRRYPLERIVLEITEHDAVEDYQALSADLASLRADGLRLAIDDAGAGHASFRHITRLRPEIIKLDRSLVDGISTRAELRALAVALARFAVEVGGTVIAEGVETEHDRDVLREITVDKAQGYLFGRPRPIPEYRFAHAQA